MKNKTWGLAAAWAVFAAAVLLTSCVEVEQSVSRENGSFVVGYKMLVDKSLLSMMGEEASDIFEEFEYLAPDAEQAYLRNFRKIDTNASLGMAFELDTSKVSRRDIEAEELLGKLLPSAKDTELVIPLLDFASNSEEVLEGYGEYGDLMEMMFEGYNYVVNIDSSAFRSVGQAKLCGTNYGRQVELETLSVEKVSANLSRISIPMLALFFVREPVVKIRTR